MANFDWPSTLALFEKDWQRIAPRAAMMGQDLRNTGPYDHLALRTLEVPGASLVDVTASLRTTHRSTGTYHFVAQHLHAESFSPKTGAGPRVFVSSLDPTGLPASLQSILREVGAACRAGPAALSSSTVTVADYQALALVSEYAAWIAAFGLRANHFAVRVEDSGFARVEDALRHVEAQGFTLLQHDDGRITEGSETRGLIQGSTRADVIPWTFADGTTTTIPGGYLEICGRYPRDGEHAPYDGFITAQAQHLFTSTDSAT